MRLQRFVRLFCAILPILATQGFSQTTDFPRVEVFGGYQYVNGDAGPLQETANGITDFYDLPRLEIGNRFDAHGWDGSVQVNATSWLSGVFDVSGAYGKKEIDLLPLLVAAGYDTTGISSAVARADLDDYSFMGGPQITIRRSKSFQPFVRALFGVVHGKEADNIYVNELAIDSDLKYDDTSFAFAVGGGIDAPIAESYAIRVGADYVRTKLFEIKQDNVRAFAGITYRFGGRREASTAPSRPNVQVAHVPNRLGIGTIPVERGLRIEQIESGSPAARANFRTGDVIVSVNGTAVNSPDQLARMLSEAGPTAKIRYYRGYWESETTVQLN